MDLRRLQVFSKVYEKRSFSRAAEEVLLSQPTVSGHIKSLEEELGTDLFDRLGREILPTKAADLLYGHSKRILEMVEEAQQAVDGFLGRLSGEMLVGGSTIPGQYVLPELVARFRLMHPEVITTLRISDTGLVAGEVLSGEVELGLVGAMVEDERLAFTAVMKDELMVAAAPDHPLAGKTVEPQELILHSFILREPGSGTRMMLSKALAEAGVNLSKLDVAAQMGSTVATVNGIRAGLGLGVASRRAVADDLASGRLAEVKVEGLDFSRDLYLVTRKKRTLSPAASAFIALLMAEPAE